MFKTLGIFWILSWLLGSSVGRLLLGLAVLWYLDNRYMGLLAALWAPVARWQRTAALRQAVATNPTDVRSMVELGETYLRGGRPGAAAEYLEQAYARGEDSPRALALLGAAWIRLGRHAEGRAKVESALAQKPDLAYGEPYLYLLEEALATEGPNGPRSDALVGELERFEGVEVLTRAGQLLGAAGRREVARRLLDEAVRNYGYIPKPMRRRERRWLFRARLALFTLR